jgi:predicted nuclease of predicted toxin-antitoxin system
MSSFELKFLVDVGVSKEVEEYLLEQGYDTKTVRAIDTRMSDQEIIRLAASEGRMVITMDKDFGELVYHSAMKHCGVLLLRLEDATGLVKLEVVRDILESYSDQIKNHFCVYQNNKFRIRRIKR